MLVLLAYNKPQGLFVYIKNILRRSNAIFTIDYLVLNQGSAPCTSPMNGLLNNGNTMVMSLQCSATQSQPKHLEYMIGFECRNSHVGRYATFIYM